MENAAPNQISRAGFDGLSREQLGFGILCVLAMIAIICGALYEIGRVRRENASGQSVVSRTQFILRMCSAGIWLLALGALAYASTLGLPTRNGGLLPKQWAAMVGGALGLVLVALALLVYDVVRVSAQTRAQEKRFQQQLELLAQSEIARAQTSRSDKTDTSADAVNRFDPNTP